MLGARVGRVGRRGYRRAGVCVGRTQRAGVGGEGRGRVKVRPGAHSLPRTLSKAPRTNQVFDHTRNCANRRAGEARGGERRESDPNPD